MSAPDGAAIEAAQQPVVAGWPGWRAAGREFLLFGFKQANACLFGGYLVTLVIVTALWYPLHGIHRYDFLFIAALLFQLVLVVSRLESPKEALVILAFHVLATIMELF